MTDVIARVMGLVVAADTARAMKKEFPELAADLTTSVAQSMSKLSADLEHHERTARAYDTRLTEEDNQWRQN